MFKVGEMVRIKDIRNKPYYPDWMRMMSGQAGSVIGIKCYDRDGTGQMVYYELTVDDGLGAWTEDVLEPIKSEQDEQEWIDTVLKLIAEIEGKLDQLKRQLWRRKHYGNRNN